MKPKDPLLDHGTFRAHGIVWFFTKNKGVLRAPSP